MLAVITGASMRVRCLQRVLSGFQAKNNLQFCGCCTLLAFIFAVVIICASITYTYYNGSSQSKGKPFQTNMRWLKEHGRTVLVVCLAIGLMAMLVVLPKAGDSDEMEIDVSGNLPITVILYYCTYTVIKLVAFTCTVYRYLVYAQRILWLCVLKQTA